MLLIIRLLDAFPALGRGGGGKGERREGGAADAPLRPVVVAGIPCLRSLSIGVSLSPYCGLAVPPIMSKKFLTSVIQQSAELSDVAAGRLAADVIAAIKAEIVDTGRFTLPDFGSFTVVERPRRTGRNPATGEAVAIKASATVRFKPSPALKEAAHAGLKKNKRRAAKSG